MVAIRTVALIASDRDLMPELRSVVDTSVFSEEVLEQVRSSKESLERYSGMSIPGTGKNFITEEDRLSGIEAYRKCLRGMELWKKFLERSLNESETGEMLDLLRHVRTATISSRMKYYKRGDRIISDYLAVRESPEEDRFIQFLEGFYIKIESELAK